MIHHKLIHPTLLASLASGGHGARVLIADGNYPFRTASGPNAEIIYLNLSPGLIGSEPVLDVLSDALAFEAAVVMRPEDGPEPPIFGSYRQRLGDVPLTSVGRNAFYDLARQKETCTVIATGELQLYANILLTIGVRTQ